MHPDYSVSYAYGKMQDITYIASFFKKVISLFNVIVVELVFLLCLPLTFFPYILSLTG